MDESDLEDDIIFDQATLLNRAGVKNATTIRNSNLEHRAKLAKTISLFGAFFGLGLCTAVLGATLLDLEKQIDADIEHIAYVVTARSAGYLIGAVLGGFYLYEACNGLLVISSSLIVMCATAFAIPWCFSFNVMIGTAVAMGAAMRIMSIGGNVICLNLWKKQNRPFMQALHFSFGLGAVVAPLLAEPFLSKSSQLVRIPHGHPLFVSPCVHDPLHLEFSTSRDREKRFEEDIYLDSFRPRFIREINDTLGTYALNSSNSKLIPSVGIGNFSGVKNGNLESGNSSSVVINNSSVNINNASFTNLELSGLMAANLKNASLGAIKTVNSSSNSSDKSVIAHKPKPSFTNANILPDQSNQWVNNKINDKKKILNEKNVASKPALQTTSTLPPTTTVASTHTAILNGTSSLNSTAVQIIGNTTATISQTTPAVVETTVKTTSTSTTTTQLPSVSTEGATSNLADEMEPITSNELYGDVIITSSVSPELVVSRDTSKELKDNRTEIANVSVPAVNVSSKPHHQRNHKPGTFNNQTVDYLSADFFNDYTRIHVTYAIIGSQVFFMAVCFLVAFCKYGDDTKMDISGTVDYRKTNRSLKVTILLAIVFFFLYVCLEGAFGQLLAIFAVCSRLGMSKTKSSFLLSVFWGCYALTRGFSICFSVKIGPATMLCYNFVLTTLSSLLLVLYADTQEPVLWLCVGLMGVGLASVFPCMILWCEQYFSVTPKIVSLYMIGSAFGEMAVSMGVGKFLAQSPMVLMYSIFGLDLTCGLVFALAWYTNSGVARYSVSLSNFEANGDLVARYSQLATTDQDEVVFNANGHTFLPTLNETEIVAINESTSLNNNLRTRESKTRMEKND